MADKEFAREAAIADLRSAAFSLDVPAEIGVEVERVPGWRYQFIPAEGPQAGKHIERTFIAGDGTQRECVAVLIAHYGAASSVWAGRSLHTEGAFGWWDPKWTQR